MLSLAEIRLSDPGVDVPSGISILGTPLERGAGASVAEGMAGEFPRTGNPIASVESSRGEDTREQR